MNKSNKLFVLGWIAVVFQLITFIINDSWGTILNLLFCVIALVSFSFSIKFAKQNNEVKEE